VRARASPDGSRRRPVGWPERVVDDERRAVKKRCRGGRVDGERNEWWRHQRAGIRLWVGSASDFSTTSPTNPSGAGRVVRTSVPEHYRFHFPSPLNLYELFYGNLKVPTVFVSTSVHRLKNN
jgi:hypothetical protein